MHLAYDKRNLAGAVKELMRVAPERAQDAGAVGRGGQVMDLTQADQAEDFLRYRAERLASSCFRTDARPTLEWPILGGVAFWSIEVSLEPFYSEQEGNGLVLPENGTRPDYFARFLKFLGA